MSRQLRIEFQGALYHAMARGNARQAIVLDDHDRLNFFATLERVLARFGWLCHAYCLMDNHYHLVVETPRPNLARGMRELNGVHAQTFNARHRRSEHLFGGRYKAVLVQREPYLLELCRYVALNPLRAGLPARRLARWRWSSYRATAGFEPTPPYLHTDWILGHFGRDREQAQRAYRAFARSGLGSDPGPTLRAALYLGDLAFVRKYSRGRSRLAEIRRDQQQPIRTSLEQLLREQNDSGILRAYRQHGYKLREIADLLGVHYSTISRRLKAAEADLARTP